MYRLGKSEIPFSKLSDNAQQLLLSKIFEFSDGYNSSNFTGVLHGLSKMNMKWSNLTEQQKRNLLKITENCIENSIPKEFSVLMNA
jgi:hypothetical protein